MLKKLKKKPHSVEEACRDLMAHQRGRRSLLKTRIQNENRLRSFVATAMGYHTGMDEKSRRRAHKKAQLYINKVLEQGASERLVDSVIENLSVPILHLDDAIEQTEKKMKELAKCLPAAKWSESIKGFGILGLAKVIGETGNLNNYPNPAKVWRRMGCAPYRDHMAKTWRVDKWRQQYGLPKLSDEEWTEYGYCPHRRSTIFVVSEGLMKQNDGPYRQRYDEARKSGMKKWPKDIQIKERDGKKVKVSMHAHMHGLLLCGKLLLKDLWIQWTQ